MLLAFRKIKEIFILATVITLRGKNGGLATEYLTKYRYQYYTLDLSETLETFHGMKAYIFTHTHTHNENVNLQLKRRKKRRRTRDQISC